MGAWHGKKIGFVVFQWLFGDKETKLGTLAKVRTQADLFEESVHLEESVLAVYAALFGHRWHVKP